MMPIGKMITDVAKLIERQNCSNYDSVNPCSICNNEKRDKSIICIVEEVQIYGLWKGEVYTKAYITF